MSLDPREIRGGMKFYASDGEEIGTVAGIAAAPNIIEGVAAPGRASELLSRSTA
jgi:hypothetical protein